MSKDIKKALEHCINNECVDCPNNEELGSGEIVCRGRLLPEVLEYVADLEAKLAESEKNYKDARELGIEQFHSLKEIINSSQEEIDKLKQQLAGKGREIADLQHRLEVAERAVESAVEIANIKSNHFWTVEELKEQAEAEINKRSNNDE